jgi:ferrochelatase
MSSEALLLAYGGPERLEEVPDYLLDVRGGRPTPAPLVEEIVERYRRIGGGSPILALTRAQAAGVERHLGLRVRVGMRHWHPYIGQAVTEAHRDGATHLVAIPMSPFYSSASIAAYAEKLQAALEEGMSATLIHSWHLYPPFLAAVVEKVRQAREGFEEAAVIFTAHSLPQRLKDQGDPYDGQLRAASEAVAKACGIAAHGFAYQSPGRVPEPWMGPFVEEEVSALAARGERKVLIVPIGFVCDHVEVLYDIDVVLAEHARQLGMELRRPESLNASAAFVEALAGLVTAALQGRTQGFLAETLSRN